MQVSHPLESQMLRCGVPEHMHDGIQLWIDHGIGPGSFLWAVICNDLRGAIGKADHVNKSHIANFVQFFYSHAPSPCWGSEEKATAWASHGGLEGLHQATSKSEAKFEGYDAEGLARYSNVVL